MRYAPHLWGKCADCSLGRATSVGQGKHVPCKDRMVDGFADSDVGAEDATCCRRRLCSMFNLFVQKPSMFLNCVIILALFALQEASARSSCSRQDCRQHESAITAGKHPLQVTELRRRCNRSSSTYMLYPLSAVVHLERPCLPVACPYTPTNFVWVRVKYRGSR